MVKQSSHVSLHIMPIPEEELIFGVFADASLATDPNENSQGGYLTVATHQDMLTGKECNMSCVSWKSWKLKRRARSSLSAEIQALSDGVDDLQYTRLFWHALTHPVGLNLREVDNILSQTRSFAITDCRSLYDSVNQQESSTLGLSEKRSAIEVLALRETIKPANIELRWVHSGRQLADYLTKVRSQ
eukprot:1150850-Amphidinium_carterae.2